MVLLVLASGSRTFAQPAGITVTGAGSVAGRPGIVELSAVVSGEGELASDASVRYRDARRRAVDALERLKVSNLSIESDGVSVSQPPVQQMAMLNQMTGASEVPKQRIVVTETIRLVLKDVEGMDNVKVMDLLLRLVDTARDNGLQVGGSDQPGQPGRPTSVVYRLSNPSALKERAYKQAMEDARSRASALAELSGAKLGRIVSVREIDLSEGRDRTYESTVLGEVPVKVQLSVQFEIVR